MRPIKMPGLPQHIEREWLAEELRHIDALVRFVTKYPEWRTHFAYALLGGAVAFCDTFGIDPIEFIAELRKDEPMPQVLTPPKNKQS